MTKSLAMSASAMEAMLALETDFSRALQVVLRNNFENPSRLIRFLYSAAPQSQKNALFFLSAFLGHRQIFEDICSQQFADVSSFSASQLQQLAMALAFAVFGNSPIILEALRQLHPALNFTDIRPLAVATALAENNAELFRMLTAEPVSPTPDIHAAIRFSCFSHTSHALRHFPEEIRAVMDQLPIRRLAEIQHPLLQALQKDPSCEHILIVCAADLFSEQSFWTQLQNAAMPSLLDAARVAASTNQPELFPKLFGLLTTRLIEVRDLEEETHELRRVSSFELLEATQIDLLRYATSNGALSATRKLLELIPQIKNKAEVEAQFLVDAMPQFFRKSHDHSILQIAERFCLSSEQLEHGLKAITNSSAMADAIRVLRSEFAASGEKAAHLRFIMSLLEHFIASKRTFAVTQLFEEFSDDFPELQSRDAILSLLEMSIASKNLNVFKWLLEAFEKSSPICRKPVVCLSGAESFLLSAVVDANASAIRRWLLRSPLKLDLFDCSGMMIVDSFQSQQFLFETLSQLNRPQLLQIPGLLLSELASFPDASLRRVAVQIYGLSKTEAVLLAPEELRAACRKASETKLFFQQLVELDVPIPLLMTAAADENFRKLVETKLCATPADVLKLLSEPKKLHSRVL